MPRWADWPTEPKSKSRAHVDKLRTEVQAFIGLGSNLGDRLEYLCKAIRQLSAHPQLRLVTLSSVYQTEAIGKTDQPDFINSVAEMQTSLSPIDLVHWLLQIEAQLGRQRLERWGARTIDLDLLTMNAIRMREPELTLPHPRLTQRLFVLLPFAEIAPDYRLPGRQQSIAQLLTDFRHQQRIEKILSSLEFRQRIQTI